MRNVVPRHIPARMLTARLTPKNATVPRSNLIDWRLSCCTAKTAMTTGNSTSLRGLSGSRLI